MMQNLFGDQSEEEEEEEEVESEHESNRQPDYGSGLKHKAKKFRGSLKSKEIESDDDTPPRKMATHHQMALIYDSDEE